MNSKAKKKFTIDVGWVFIGSVFTLITAIILKPILGKSFGAAGLGQYSMTVTLYTLASYIFIIGIDGAIIKYIAEYKENKDKFYSFLSCGVTNSLILGILLAIIMHTSSNFFAGFFNIPQFDSLLRTIAFVFPFLLVNNVCIGALNGLRYMKHYTLVTIARSAFVVVLTLIFLYLGWGIKGAILALVFSEAIVFVLLFFFLLKFFSHYILKNYIQTTKEILLFGSKILLGSIIFMVNTKADIILIGYFLTARATGLYAAALLFMSFFFMLPNIIQTITYPAISEYYGKKMYDSIENLISKCISYTFIVLSFLGIFLIFFSKDLMTLLFNSDFLPAITPLAILILGGVLYGSIASIGSVFPAISRPDLGWKVNAITAFVNLSLDILLIPKFGIIGAAIATSTSFLMLTGLSIYFIHRLLSVRIKSGIYIKAAIFICLIAILFFTLGNWFNLYMLKIVLITFYIIYIYIFLLTREDKAFFRDMLSIKTLSEMIKGI